MLKRERDRLDLLVYELREEGDYIGRRDELKGMRRASLLLKIALRNLDRLTKRAKRKG